MKLSILIAAAALAVSGGAAFAAEQPASGYLFPNDGSPAGEDATGIVVPQRASPGIGGLPLTHVYLFPPSDINDDSNGAG